jgi:hypothetical protein
MKIVSVGAGEFSNVEGITTVAATVVVERNNQVQDLSVLIHKEDDGWKLTQPSKYGLSDDEQAQLVKSIIGDNKNRLRAITS